MPEGVTLEALVSRWHALREQGQPVSVEDLCAESPHLLDDCRRRLEAVKAIEGFLDLGQTTPAATATSDTVPDGAAPTPTVPGYEILGELGRGAMGVVYRARHLRLDRLVALKMILHVDRVGSEGLARFRGESEAVARLQHPGIVQVFEVGEHQGAPYMALEFVDGPTLANTLGGGPQSPKHAADFVRDLSQAMQHAHEQGIIHRDLKPSNILLTTTGAPKITDFGLAKKLDAALDLSHTGAVMGTPSYMAPEQALGKGKEVGPLADVYALGAILYEMLTGRPPFRGATMLETLDQVRTQEPNPVRRLQPKVPRDLETICHKCLEKDPRKRFASAQELANRLQLFRDGKPIPDRPRSWLNKFGRFIIRHPTLTLGVVLLVGLTVGTTLLVRYVNLEKPEQPEKSEKAEVPVDPRQTLDEKLARGEAIRFDGGEPLPGPFRQIYGPPAPLTRVKGVAHFSVESLEIVMWELTANPLQNRYRFAADVRHDASGVPSRVGIYFGYREIYPVGQPRRAGFYTLCFADRGGLISHNANGTVTSQVSLEARLFEEKATPYMAHSVPFATKQFEPALPVIGPGPWRRLVVTVTPEGVETAWEPEPGNREVIGYVSASSLQKVLVNLAKATPRLQTVPTDYTPQLGLGIFLSSGKASLQNVTLEPLINGD